MKMAMSAGWQATEDLWMEETVGETQRHAYLALKSHDTLGTSSWRREWDVAV